MAGAGPWPCLRARAKPSLYGRMAEFVPGPPFDLVVFGATGDLSLRKLFPALLHRFLDGQIPAIGNPQLIRIKRLVRGVIQLDELEVAASPVVEDLIDDEASLFLGWQPGERF